MTENDKTALVEALAPITSRVRRDVCWKKTDDGPRRIDEPLTDDRLRQHVAGGPGYGAAPILPGESVTRLGVLDFDSHRGATSWSGMQAAAARVCAALAGQGGAPIAFRSSGGQGIHLYCLWDTPQDAFSVRQWLRAALATAGFAPGTKGVADGQVEIFPKQDSVAPTGRYGNMFVLPLAGQSVPLDLFDLDDLPPDYLIGMTWPLSASVPVVEKPERGTALALPGADIQLLEHALAAIPNDTEPLDYDAWRDIVFGIHHATGGDDYGLELAHAFSARSPKYDPDFIDNRVWPYIDSTRDAAVTMRSVLYAARQHGWTEPDEHIAGDFDVVAAPAGDTPDQPMPAFDRDKKGEIYATMGNLALGVRDVRTCGLHIRYDNFRAEIMAAPADDADGWVGFGDADYTRMQIYMERGGFQKIAKEALRDAVWLVAQEHQFDSAIEWLSGVVWDGVPRIDGFLTRYCTVADTPYSRAVSRYIWSALAGRVMQPGVKVDMVPVLIGAQGARKSTGVAAMAPAGEFFTEMDLASRDAEASRRMRGRLVIELAELKGLHTRDAEAIKAFITRCEEEWRVLYKEFNTKFPRRHLFIGTSNPAEFLSDDTGERRWLPVEVQGHVDVAAIERDRLQLWAEGREHFAAVGVDWQEAEALARTVHGQHKISDAWEPIIGAWLDGSDFDDMSTEGVDVPAQVLRKRFAIHEVLVGALGFDMKHVKRGEEMRVASILKKFGFAKKREFDSGKRVMVWVQEITNTQETAYSQDFAHLV